MAEQKMLKVSDLQSDSRLHEKFKKFVHGFYDYFILNAKSYNISDIKIITDEKNSRKDISFIFNSLTHRFEFWHKKDKEQYFFLLDFRGNKKNKLPTHLRILATDKKPLPIFSFNNNGTLFWQLNKPTGGTVEGKEKKRKIYKSFFNNEENYILANNISENETYHNLLLFIVTLLNGTVEGAKIMSTETKTTFEQIKELIDNEVSQLILTGAPGTGKTYTAKAIAKEIGKKEPDFVQFHPSFDYTDFIEGLRPVSIKTEDKTKEEVTFKKVDGIFKAFCRSVVEENTKNNNEEKKHFFIIDEINRADLSNVLGELMYCLEKDKRGEKNKVQTQYSNLPTWDIDNDCFKDGFYIPKNVIIIGTMNDIDRSVESFDFALRRRFMWFEVKVTDDTLRSAFAVNEEFPFTDTIKEELVERIMSLNNIIAADGKPYGLNEHYFISQGHFTSIPEDKRADTKELCQYVWDYRLKSLLEEYVRGEEQDNINTFINKCENIFLTKNKASL